LRGRRSAFTGRHPIAEEHEPVLWLEDLVKDPVVGEMVFLSFLPAAENLVHGNEFHRAELAGIFRRGLGIARAVKIPAGDVLASSE